MVKRVGKKYEVIVRFSGHQICLGMHEYRSEAIKAESIALKIRTEIDRHQNRTNLIDRYKVRESMAEMKNAAIEPGF